MTQAQTWNLREIRQRIVGLLDLADCEAAQLPHDHSGNTVPVSVAVLFLLDRAVKEKVFGTVEVSIRGTSVLSPKITELSFRMGSVYEDLLR